MRRERVERELERQGDQRVYDSRERMKDYQMEKQMEDNENSTKVRQVSNNQEVPDTRGASSSSALCLQSRPDGPQ